MGLYRSFLKSHKEIFGFEVNPTLWALVGPIWFWNIQGSLINAPPADMVKSPARMFVVQWIAFVHQHHRIPIPSFFCGSITSPDF